MNENNLCVFIYIDIYVKKETEDNRVVGRYNVSFTCMFIWILLISKFPGKIYIRSDLCVRRRQN